MKPLVVITGASSGIGEAIARRFSEAEHPLSLLARTALFICQQPQSVLIREVVMTPTGQER